VLKKETMRRRKRALVVAMAALVMGAACSSGNSGTFKQVQGRVVDQRTGKPVAQARLEATTPQTATVSGSTDAQGRFTLGKVSKQAMLKVTATNYQPANLQLSEGPLEVQLTPVLVSGKVTSGLTQAGLQATLRGKTSEQTKTRPDGSFEISGVGPGDTLSVSAPGYTQKSVIIGGDKVKVTLSPEPATEVAQVHQWLETGDLAPVWRFVFTNPPGYRFEDVPADFKAEARKTAEGKPGIKGLDVRVVTQNGVSQKGGVADITAVAIAWDPKVAAAPGFAESNLTALAGEGARVRTFTVGGGIEVPYAVSSAPGWQPVALLLLDGAIELQLHGKDLAKLKAFVTAFFRPA
jgi:hypothetical protein